jgi:F-type H+-transporting ATPase subunit delta
MPQRSSHAKRYAEAVAGLARQDGSWDAWRRDLDVLAGAVADQRLLMALESERIAPDRKRELVDATVGGRVSPGARNLVLVLARRRRLELLPDVVTWFAEMADRAQGVRRVTVVTAAPLTDDQRTRLRQRLAGVPGAPGASGAPRASGAPPPGAREVELAEEVEPAILGGLVIRQGDVIQDYSVRARLEALRERLN